MKTEQTFEEHLRKGNLSENTITSYLWTVNYFHEHYDKISKVIYWHTRVILWSFSNRKQ